MQETILAMNSWMETIASYSSAGPGEIPKQVWTGAGLLG